MTHAFLHRKVSGLLRFPARSPAHLCLPACGALSGFLSEAERLMATNKEPIADGENCVGLLLLLKIKLEADTGISNWSGFQNESFGRCLHLDVFECCKPRCLTEFLLKVVTLSLDTEISLSQFLYLLVSNTTNSSKREILTKFQAAMSKQLVWNRFND